MMDRKSKNRYKLKSINKNAYRFVVLRTNNHVYAEIFDPNGKHVKAVNSSSKNCEVYLKNRKEKAQWVGKTIALETKDIIGNNKIYFDRGGYAYHGIVKQVAESARENGIKF